MMLLPVLAYAEVHYRFKYFVSLLRMNEPEVLADAPHRLDPGAPLPVMVLIKDADRYPVEIEQMTFTLRQGGTELHTESFVPPSPIPVRSHWWWHIHALRFDGALAERFGMFDLDVTVTLLRGGQRRAVRNNNLRTTTKRPLRVYRSRTPLPSLPGWITGDVHTHSTYTEDQVEFGSPIAAAAELSAAMGLSFFCATDHSYDLDDRVDDYLQNDPAIPKWHAFQREVDEVNRRSKDVTVVRGEEVSCENGAGRSVHFLLLGTRKFFHGSGDGAEQWFRFDCEHTIASVIAGMEPGTAAYAAHPTEEAPFLQRLLLGRGEWSADDMAVPGLHGIQILNGERNRPFRNGLAVWRRFLLEGRRTFIAAGNDAHGNFNRFIQVFIPFVYIAERPHQLFGRMRTLVRSLNTERNIVDALASGRSVITSGPALGIEVETETHGLGRIGDTVRARSIVVKTVARSTAEFGRFTSLRIVLGTVGGTERVLSEQRSFTDPFSVHTVGERVSLDAFSYIRAEAETTDGEGTDRDGFCHTNPIWITPE